MTRWPWLGLCGLLVCCGRAQAETLDEACQRLSKAAASVRSLDTTTKTKEAWSEDGTTAFQRTTHRVRMRREGALSLTRFSLDGTYRTTGPALLFPKRTRGTLAALTVNDGKFLWAEFRDPQLKQVTVLKMHASAEITPPTRPPQKGAAHLPCALAAGMSGLPLKDLSAALEGLKAFAYLKHLGKGTVLKRPTTVIESVCNVRAVAALPKTVRVKLKHRLVIHFDDATGVPILIKGYDMASQELLCSETTAIEVNREIDKALFRYTPPKGAAVADATKAAAPPGPRGDGQEKR